MDRMYKLLDGKVLVLEGDKKVKEYASVSDLLKKEDDFKRIEHMYGTILEKLENDEKELKTHIEKLLVQYFTEKLSKSDISEDNFMELEDALFDNFKDFCEHLYKEIDSELYNKINNMLGKKHANGGNMFKTIKEAKDFTAHLDALANEIESLQDIGSDMKKHLAFRLDRLSDLIESSTVKEASVQKEANGIGSGAWEYDKDEAKYMSTMGGTGALEGDKDEAHYMKEFKGDDHKEVLERKEPSEINGAGAKKKQPSDNYNEAEVAKNLKKAVKNVLAKMK